jgi:hypothetical protein
VAEILGAASVSLVSFGTRRDFLGGGGGGDEVGEVLACFNLACFDRTFDRGIRADEIGIGFVEERDCGELTVGKSHVMASVDFLPQMGQGSVVLH